MLYQIDINAFLEKHMTNKNFVEESNSHLTRFNFYKETIFGFIKITSLH